MPRKRTREDFIERARAIHGDKYDYSKVVYKGVHEKVCIICPKHGEFWQEPNNHISRKSICPKCSYEMIADLNRSDTDSFIKKARKVHGDKYDYSRVEYRQYEEKVCIICPEHGEFWQTPHNHVNGAGCPKCANMYVPTTEEFIAASKAIFGDKYDYSKTEYKGNKHKVCIICPEHGEFWVTPNNHISGKVGCSRCTGYYDLTLEEFIEEANKRFDNKYDYSRVVWKGFQKKVEIICPEHGVFIQTPMAHLKSQGCGKCNGTYMDQDYFIEKSTAIHGGKYDYSKVHYVDNRTPVCIICPKHGEFYQSPNGHLLGHGCKKCYAEETSARLTKTEENFLSIANEVHKGKYDYSQMQYVNRNTPIKIICPTHGPFMQVPKNHIKGSGCPMCNSSVLEDTITNLLKKNNISFVPQKTFEWLTFNGTLHLDFYLPDYDIAIECQGIQHFQPVEFWGGEDGLENTKKRDQVKKELCESKGIKMLYFSNLGIRYPYPVIEDQASLIKMIVSKGKAENPFWTPDPELPLSFD